MNIENKVNFDIHMFTYQVIKQLLPDWLFEFSTMGELQTKSTQLSKDLFVKRTNSGMGGRVISVWGPKVWNNVLTDIKNSSSIQVFKNKLKNYLLKE